MQPGMDEKNIQLQGRLLDKTQKTPETVLYPVQVSGLMTGLGGR
jgi:hypothetical protein